MDAKNPSTLLVLITLLLVLGSSYVNATWEAKLYSFLNQKLDYVIISEQSESSCVNLESLEICDKNNNNCRSAATSSTSISTMGTCVRLFSSSDCSGSPLMTIRPGTHCHDSWDQCGLKSNVKSIGGCLLDQITISGEVLFISPFSIASPNYPENYNPNTEVNWIITTLPEQKIKIKFKDFEIEDHFSCNYDKVIITDFNSQEIIYEGCGDQLPPTLISRSNQVMVKFKTDGSTSYKGFSLDWESCTECQSTNSTRSWSSSTTLPIPISIVAPYPIPLLQSTTTTATTTTPAPPTISTSDHFKEALIRVGLVSFHTGANFEGNSYSENITPGCHEMPPFIRLQVGSLNDAWKGICLYSEKNCRGKSISTENLDRNTQLANLTTIGWGNKINSWKPSLKGSTC